MRTLRAPNDSAPFPALIPLLVVTGWLGGDHIGRFKIGGNLNRCDPRQQFRDTLLLLRGREIAQARGASGDTVAQWLAGIFGGGPIVVSELHREVEAAGYSWTTVRRAHDELGVTAQKTGYDDGWAWRLPEVPTPGTEIEL